MAGENWTFWFNMTNFALGMITVLALAVVFGAVGWDLLVRKAPKPRAVNAADLERVGAEIDSWFKAGPHSLTVPGLGLTMADGGGTPRVTSRGTSTLSPSSSDTATTTNTGVRPPAAPPK